MFPEPPESRCPWCSGTLEVMPGDGVCPHCGQPCDERVYAVDVFEGRSRPRLLLAVVGWFFVAVTAAVVVLGALGSGQTGDVLIFGLFLIVLLVIAAAETHGVWLMRRGTGSRRLILTTEGVEVINQHQVRGIYSATWDEVHRVEVDGAKRGGSYIQVYTEDTAKAAVRVVTASDKVMPEQVRFEMDRLRELGQE